jgi:transposase
MKPKLTEDLIQEMARLKRDGLTNKDICRAVGIHEATLYRWVGKPTTRLHRALCEELKKAESDYKAQLLNTIRAAALAKNSYWTAAAWLLERKYPDEYGRVDRRADAGKATDAPTIVLGVTVSAAEGDAGATDD